MVQSNRLASIVTSLGISGIIAATFGPLSFNITFILVEWYKITLVTFIGVSNMSVVLQTLTIMDNE